MSKYGELLDALDDFREQRYSWNVESARPGFYDPQGHQEERAKQVLADAEKRLDAAFEKIIKNLGF